MKISNQLLLILGLAGLAWFFSRSKSFAAPLNKSNSDSTGARYIGSSPNATTSDVIARTTQRAKDYATKANDAANGVGTIITAGAGALKTIVGLFPGSSDDGNSVTTDGSSSPFDPMGDNGEGDDA